MKVSKCIAITSYLSLPLTRWLQLLERRKSVAMCTVCTTLYQPRSWLISYWASGQDFIISTSWMHPALDMIMMLYKSPEAYAITIHDIQGVQHYVT